MLEISATTIFGLLALVGFVIYLVFFSDSPGGGVDSRGRNKKDAADKEESKEGSKPGSAPNTKAGSITGTKGGPRPRLDIFFGSQTGTAEGFARELQQCARNNNFEADAIDLDNFTPELIQECRAAVFLIATYGEGEPTDNSKAFVRWLRKGTSDGDLDNLNYCVFGLGSTNYELYNTMGTLVDKKLARFGGKRVLPLSLGDEVGLCYRGIWAAGFGTGWGFGNGDLVWCLRFQSLEDSCTIMTTETVVEWIQHRGQGFHANPFARADAGQEPKGLGEVSCLGFGFGVSDPCPFAQPGQEHAR